MDAFCHLALAAALAASASAALAADPAPPSLDGRDARLSKLIARPLDDPQGHAVARVRDAIVNLEQQRVVALVVDDHGTLRTCPIAPNALVLGLDDMRVPAGTATLDALHCEPGAPTRDMAAKPTRVRASDLLKAHFYDGSGDGAGEMREVVVDAKTGRIHYLLGSFRPDWVQAGQVVALPPRPVTMHDGHVALKADLFELQRLPLFEEKRIADVWSPAFAQGMDRYLHASR